MGNYAFKWTQTGGIAQVRLENGQDIAHLAELDRKHWLVISMPVGSVRCDRRMLELMDTDGDGRIRTCEVLSAIEFLKEQNVDFDELFKPSEEDRRQLDEVLSRMADLTKAELSTADHEALAAWEERGKSDEVAFLGEATAAAEAALAAVESIIDGFFEPPDDMPLVSDEPDPKLPLYGRINPKHLEAIEAFAEKCVVPVLGRTSELDRRGWNQIKAAFGPYRAWRSSKPVANARIMGELAVQERVLRYKLGLLELLENYVNMRRLYAGEEAIFQTGILRIDAKELKLCFHVDSEAAHSALAGRSNCRVLYLKLTRPGEGAVRTIAAVVTAGSTEGLYVGRNGVFYDRDGKDWEAVVVKVVENPVSLREAFFAPWKKLGECIASTARKFLGEKQSATQKNLENGAKSAEAGGAAMASSVAAIGIGIAMAGAALASVMAAVTAMSAFELAVSVMAVVLVVSLPSVALTYLKLRRRDLGAILNAGGWAVNRPMRFSVKRAREFTRCAGQRRLKILLAALIIVVALAVGVYICMKIYASGQAAGAQPPAASAEESKPAA